MIFITMGKLRKKLTKEFLAQSQKLFEQAAEQGIKFTALYWTLGRYDMVGIVEAKDEKTVMKGLIQMGDLASTETLTAVPREEAIKLVE